MSRSNCIRAAIISAVLMLISAVFGCEQTLRLPGASPNGTVATPAFSPEGGLFRSSQQVEVCCMTPGAVIRFTTDGSIPTEDSPAYTEAITVTEENSPLVITARAFMTSMTPSETVVHSYSVDDSAPLIGSGIYGWAKDTGWAVSWPASEDDVESVTFSMTAGGQTVEETCSPGVQYCFIAASDFNAPPSPYDDSAFTDIRLVYTDYAGNTSAMTIEKNTEAVAIAPSAGYYIAPQSVSLTAAGGTTVFYTVNGGNPDMDANRYTNPIYLSGNTSANTMKAACFSAGEMTFVYSSENINIDSAWDDSFLFDTSAAGIDISWTDPYAALPDDHFTDLTLGFERISDGATDSAVFVPADADAFTFDNSSAVFTGGAAYDVSVSARDESAANIQIDTYEDVYLRTGIILCTDTVASSYPLSVTGAGTPWGYTASAAASELFTVADRIRRPLRSSDGSMLYYILNEDNPATADQLWSYDFSAAPVQLSTAAGDVIDFALNGAGDLIYLAAADLAASAFQVTTLTPGSPPAVKAEYSFAPPAAPTGVPAEIDMFDGGNIVIRYATGELSAHTYPSAAEPEAITIVPLAGISGAATVFGTDSGFFYTAENSDGAHTDIFQLTALTPASIFIDDLDDTDLAFHDISEGGKNILFSAVDYSYYDGERLFAYNITRDDVIEVIDLEGGSFAGLAGASW